MFGKEIRLRIGILSCERDSELFTTYKCTKVKTIIGGLPTSVKARHFFSVAFSVASHQMAAILSVQGKGGLNYSTYTSDAAG